MVSYLSDIKDSSDGVAGPQPFWVNAWKMEPHFNMCFDSVAATIYVLQ